MASDTVLSPRLEENQDWGLLTPGECFWRDHYTWLEECGYLLRSRYKPDWRPSWRGTDEDWTECEDGQKLLGSQINSATRKSTGEMIGLKRVEKRVHPYESEIAEYFARELASDPRNHCVPIYEVLQSPHDPDVIILVMPFLRGFRDPRFRTVGEVVDFLAQVFEGLHFMHDHLVAHRDCTFLNIMMDPRPLYPNMFHPVDDDMKPDWKGIANHYSRTARPTKYYFIDFGLSRKYTPSNAPFLEDIIRGGDKSPPEFRDYFKPCNPFPTDVYCLGNAIRQTLLEDYSNLEFVVPLIVDMTLDDPAQRPLMADVVDRFSKLRSKLWWWKLRARLVRRSEGRAKEVLNDAFFHVFWTTTQLILCRRSVPSQ